MNAEEFKKAVEDKEAKVLSNYIKKHEDTYGETLEQSIDNVLKKELEKDTIDEPFELNVIAKKKEKNNGEWIEYYPNDTSKHRLLQINDIEVYDTETEVNGKYIKRRFLPAKYITNTVFKYREKYLTSEASFFNMSKQVQDHIKDIFTNKGFFVIVEFHSAISSRSYTSWYTASVYWNKEQYEIANANRTNS